MSDEPFDPYGGNGPTREMVEAANRGMPWRFDNLAGMTPVSQEQLTTRYQRWLHDREAFEADELRYCSPPAAPAPDPTGVQHFLGGLFRLLTLRW